MPLVTILHLTVKMILHRFSMFMTTTTLLTRIMTKKGMCMTKEGIYPHEKTKTKEKIEFQLGGNIEEHDDLGYQVRQNEGVMSEDDTTLVGQMSVAKSSVTHDQPPPYSKTEDRRFSGDKEPNVAKQAFKKDKNGVKAFLEDSSKTVPKDVGNVENNNSKNETSKKSKTVSPDISTKPQALSLQKSSDVEIVKIPQIIIESPIEMFSFTVDERGCNVSSPIVSYILHLVPQKNL
uniref:uncharacterized protein LOC120348558 isoform X2 n=1 Tax=Styela clava TaxID=7725 RepID=UPI00193985BC|nr:uncharacterized protein LOC120348558 isoform X2 [Styela clava]